MRLKLFASVIVLLLASLLVPAGGNAAKMLYIGGTMSRTGPYSQDSAAMLVVFENYVKYVNETKLFCPWSNEKFPADIALGVSRLPIHEALKLLPNTGLVETRQGGASYVRSLLGDRVRDLFELFL